MFWKLNPQCGKVGGVLVTKLHPPEALKLYRGVRAVDLTSCLLALLPSTRLQNTKPLIKKGPSDLGFPPSNTVRNNPYFFLMN